MSTNATEPFYGPNGHIWVPRHNGGGGGSRTHVQDMPDGGSSTGLVRSWNLPAGNGRAARDVCLLISAAGRGRRGGLSGAAVRQAEATLSAV